MAPRKAAAQKSLVMNFKRDKETKTTVRFMEDTDAEYKHTFYVKTTTLVELGNPDSFSVEITPA